MTAGFNRECSWHQKDDFDMEIANVMTVVSHVSACVVQTLFLQSPGYNCTTSTAHQRSYLVHVPDRTIVASRFSLLLVIIHQRYSYNVPCLFVPLSP